MVTPNRFGVSTMVSLWVVVWKEIPVMSSWLRIRSYKNFHLRLEYRLIGTEGFINGGVQFHSQRISDPPNEMVGYQADIGAGLTGHLYDESRRRRFLIKADTHLVSSIERVGEWNHYEIIARGNQVKIFLNGKQTIEYQEQGKGIPQEGHIALQIHGNCKAKISFRNLYIEELEDTDALSQADDPPNFHHHHGR